MNNLLENLDDFDEDSQRILEGVYPSNFIDFETRASNFKKIMLPSSPDYRSSFHDHKNTPLGYSYLTDDPVSAFSYTGVDDKGEKGYEYTAEVLPCENGSQVLGSYNSNKREAHKLCLFYEKPHPSKSSFAGDFYIVKMGGYFVTMFKNFPKPIPSKINGKPFKEITSMKDEAGYLAQLAYTYEKDILDTTLVHQALMREYQFYTGDRQFEEIIGNISSIPADAIGWCAKQLESLKPTEKNYNPDAKDFSPLIPIIGGLSVPVNINKAAQFFENLGDNPFVQGAEVAFSQVWSIVEQTASKVKDASIDHLPETFKNLVEKITGIVNVIKTFLSDIKDIATSYAKKGIEILKILNALNCGFTNGLVGLVQCILYILEFLLQPTTKLSYIQFLERRDLLEKAEDVIDWISENAPKFLQAIKDLFKGSGDLSLSDMEGILDKMKAYFEKFSRYKIAFYVGTIAFEVLINILLLIFTGGVGNVVKGSTYVQKATSLLKVLTREMVSAVTMGITDLLAFLSRFIINFGKACAKGFKGFIKWIEDLFTGAKNGTKADDLAEEVHNIEEVIIKGKKKNREEYTSNNIGGDGLYGGKVLSKTEIEDWAKILKKKFGTKLERVEKFDDQTVLASFNPNTNTIKYTDNVTEYFMIHEHYHAEEMFKIGFKNFTKNAHIEGTPWTIENRINQYMREKYVYERLIENAKKHKFNPEELNTPPFGHAFQYFDGLKYKLEVLLKKNNIPFPN